MTQITEKSLLSNCKESVLVIIDIQERLSAAMPENILKQVLKKTQILINSAKLLDIPVIISEQYPKGLGSTLPVLKSHLSDNAIIEEKSCFSCASNLSFNEALKRLNRKQVVIAGMEAHICVLQTAIELQQQDYQVFIAADAICSRLKSHFENSLLRMQQATCIISNAESVCFEWLRDATHSQFKNISGLIK